MDWLVTSAHAETDAIDSLRASSPLEALPSTFGQNVEAAWDSMWSEHLAASDELQLQYSWDQYLKGVRDLTGERLMNPAEALGNFGIDNPAEALGDIFSEALFDKPWAMSRSGRYQQAAALTRQRLEDLRKKHPGLQVKGHEDMVKVSGERAAAVRGHAARVRAGADFWGDVGFFLGGAGAAVADPPNLATMMVGAPAGAGILRTALIEARLGIGVELASLPSVAKWRDDIGNPMTAAEAVENVGLAGAGAAGMGAGFKLTGMGMGELLNVYRRARARGDITETHETRAAEQVVEAAQEVMEQSPFEDSLEGQAVHMRALGEAEGALMRGESLEGRALEEYHQHRTQKIDGLVAKARGADPDPELPDVVVFGRVSPGQADEIAPAAAKHLPKNAQLHTAVRRLDGDAVRKILRDHKDDEIPFQPEHFRHLPNVAETGELVEVAAKQGRFSVLRRQLVKGDWLYHLESVQMVGTATPPKKITFRTHTAYWKTGPKKGGPLPPESGLRPKRPFHEPDPPKRPEQDVRNVRDGHAGRSIAQPAGPRKPLPPSLRPPKRKPESLNAWIHRQGGLMDQGGELAHMGIKPGQKGVRPGMVNNSGGMNLDDAARNAWEAGFFPERGERRPDINDFLDALRDDFEGRHRHGADDADLVEEWRVHERNWADVDRSGIDPYGMSDFDLRTQLARRAAPTPTEAAETVSQATAAAAELDAVLYRDVQRALEKDPDFEIDYEVIDADGAVTSGVSTARDLMAAADDDLRAVEAFRSCVIGG